MNSKKSITHLIIASILVGFFLHLAWEYLQCSPLYIHLRSSPTAASMVYASLGDVVILFTSYSIVAIFSRSTRWIWNIDFTKWILVFIFVSAILAEIMEYMAINRGRWDYTLINPTLAGVSILPALQMAIINPLALLIAKKLLSLVKKDSTKI